MDRLTSPQTVPASSAHRLIGYDIARALAIFGMVIVNFKITMGAETNGPAWLVWLVGLLDGRAAATFVILAGVGISLLTRQARLSGDQVALAGKRRILIKRSAFLFCFGLLYTPVWPADILHFYGVYILIGAVLLTSSDRILWLLAIAMATAFLLLLVVADYESGWQWSTLTYTDFWTAAGMIRHLFFNGFHPVIPWTAFLLVGMWLGRKEMSDPKVRHRILAGGVTATILAELSSHLLTAWMLARFPEANPTDIRDLCGTAPMPPTPLYLLSAGGTALALIGLCAGLTATPGRRSWCVHPLVTTGQLALTLYVAHVIIGMGVLEALGRLEQQSLNMAVVSALIFCVGAVTCAVIWRRFARHGPLEWLLRQITR